MKLLNSLPAMLLPLLVVAACSSTEDGTSSGAASANTVTLRGTTFEPATITIKVGQTVTWKWASGTHDVKSGATCAPDGKFSSGDPVAGATFEQKFDTAGTFDYFCSVHCAEGMTGKVIVQ
jgi:plastocyanin